MGVLAITLPVVLAIVVGVDLVRFRHLDASWLVVSEIWPLILEKAMAKVYGSYERFEGGKPYMAFLFLTGCPSNVIYHR